MKLSKAHFHSRVHKIPELCFEDQRLSSFSGLIILQAFFTRLDLKRRLKKCFEHVPRSRPVPKLSRLMYQVMRDALRQIFARTGLHILFTRLRHRKKGRDSDALVSDKSTHMTDEYGLTAAKRTIRRLKVAFLPAFQLAPWPSCRRFVLLAGRYRSS